MGFFGWKSYFKLLIWKDGKKKSQPSWNIVERMTKLKFIECAHYTMHTHFKTQICKFTKKKSNVKFKNLAM
jgi:hypothetical protein